MTTQHKVVGAFAVAGLGLGIFYLATPGCACLPPDRAAITLLKSGMRDLRYAQRFHAEEHGQLATTVEQLELEGYPSIEITMTLVSDSVFRLEGVSEHRPEMTCELEATAATEDAIAGFTCRGGEDQVYPK